MIESQTIRELSRDPPTPHEIVTMLQEERDFLLTLPPASLNIIFKGFFSGERLGQCYTQKRWMPDADLLNAMLFAGQNNFENLQEYTYQHIQQLTVELRDSQTETIHSHNVPTDNIYKSLGIQERLVEDMLRRTGEKVIAHIYRSLLRTSGFIHYYNNLHNTYGLNTTFTPERAEIAYLATNLHDFEEDPIIQNDARIHVGKTKVIPHTHEPQHKQFFFLRRAMQSKRGRTTVQEDMQLDLDSKRIHYLQNALRALNSSQTDQDLIMEHLLGVVHEEYASIKLFNSESFVLSSIPIYVKTAADRPDNLATYFVTRHIPTQRLTPVTPDKLTNKALENIFMFNLAEIHMLLDSPNLEGSPPVYDSTNEVNSPSSLKFFPSRWGKLVLLGLSPNQLYHISEENGLPELI